MKKKILVGFIMNGKAGGVDKYLLNFLKVVSSPTVQIDFITNKIDKELQQELEKLGGSRLYEVATLKHPFLQYKQICALIKKEQYDMTYWNISTALHCIGPYASKKCGVQIRAVHSHSSGNDCPSTIKRKLLDFLHNLCKPFLARNTNFFYACSKKAGYWLFPHRIVDDGKLQVVFNAVDTNRFHFNETVREEVRIELGLQDKFTIGHIGNFCYQKNHSFLIDIFAEIIKQLPTSKLLLIGNGPFYKDIRKKVHDLKLQNSVQFLGWRSDVERLYQGMDLFLLPSNFEGLPVVGVEAQCTKLCCVFSDAITMEAKLTKDSYFLPIKNGAKYWADFIVDKRNYNRHDNVIIGDASLYSLEKQKESYSKIVKGVYV